MGAQPPQSRRNAMKKIGGLGVLATTSLAGCTGSIGGSGSEPEWPPGDGQIINLQHSGPGSRVATYQRVLSDSLMEHLPQADEINIQNGSAQGGGGMVAGNTMWGAANNGSQIGVHVIGSLLNNAAMFPDLVEYEPTGFTYLGNMNTYTRVIGVNPLTTDIDDHWQWDWEDFVEQHDELRYGLLGEGHGSAVFTRLITELDPNMDQDAAAENFVMYDGGGEARAAMQREEVDVYMGGFLRSYTVDDEIMKCQFVVSSPSFGDIHDRVQTVDSNAKDMMDSGLDEADAETVVEIILNRLFFYGPPEMPENIRDIYRDAYDEVSETSTLRSIGEEAGLDPEMNFTPLPGAELQDIIEAGWETRTENQDLLQSIMPEDQ